MSFSLVFFVIVTFVLLCLLGWALRGPRATAVPKMDPGVLEETDRSHITCFPQVQRALAKEDYIFLASKGSTQLARRVRKERREIALAYLAFLREDFQKLLQLARIIAVLSPEVEAGEEFERLRQSMKFSMHYQLIRMKLLLGFNPLLEMGSLSQAVSGLTIRLEAAMKELGERAALASELASSVKGSGLGTT